MGEKDYIKNALSNMGFTVEETTAPHYATKTHRGVIHSYPVESCMKKVKKIEYDEKRQYHVVIGPRTWRFAYHNGESIEDKKLEKMVKRAVVEKDPHQKSIGSSVMDFK